MRRRRHALRRLRHCRRQHVHLSGHLRVALALSTELHARWCGGIGTTAAHGRRCRACINLLLLPLLRCRIWGNLAHGVRIRWSVVIEKLLLPVQCLVALRVLHGVARVPLREHGCCRACIPNLIRRDVIVSLRRHRTGHGSHSRAVRLDVRLANGLPGLLFRNAMICSRRVHGSRLRGGGRNLSRHCLERRASSATGTGRCGGGPRGLFLLLVLPLPLLVFVVTEFALVAVGAPAAGEEAAPLASAGGVGL
mmetsp:Transcript_47387/g.101444  ORF Transcript_47387/g.101444 Transcript_47387/m.101444 type:complete len:251 (+) Transcript_47387:245-997(+)